MKTISNNVINELIIKNSKFITIINKLNSIDDVDKILNDIKIKYPKATHYVYAYIYNDIKKAYDDKEPSNTAGAPILNVLENNDLNKVIVVVVRYFGGIKLGAGGLLRAYTKSATNVLDKTNLLNLEKGYKIKITTDYSNQKQLDYILKDSIIINQKFDEKIEYEVLIKENDLDKLALYNYEVLSDEFIEE